MIPTYIHFVYSVSIFVNGHCFIFCWT